MAQVLIAAIRAWLESEPPAGRPVELLHEALQALERTEAPAADRISENVREALQGEITTALNGRAVLGPETRLHSLGVHVLTVEGRTRVMVDVRLEIGGAS